VQLRGVSGALTVNDNNLFFTDFNGKQVLAWTRGNAGTADLIVVLANFSDYGTPNPTDPAAQYVVSNWPATPAGGSWREVTQGRPVPLDWVGKEPIYPWEAKVYQLTYPA
jgi:pullulanase